MTLLVLLALATWARIDGIDLGWFMLDQARDVVEALHIVNGQRFPMVGPVASGLQVLGPLYYYLLAIPFSVSYDPALSVVFLHILNLVGVYLTYRFGKEVFGLATGLVAAALYATFPMAAISAMALWNPGFLPFFSILFMFSLSRYAIARRPWWLVASLGSLAALLQIHLTGGIFIVLLVVALLLFRPPVCFKPAVCGLVLALILYSPYLFFEFQRGFQDLRQIVSFAEDNWTAAQAQSTVTVVWRALTAPFLLPEQFASGLTADITLPFFAGIQRVELILLAISLVYLLYRLACRPERRIFGLLALWLVLPLALFVRKKVWLLWYYFDVLYPVQFLLIGALLAVPTTWKNPRSNSKIRICLIGGAAVLVIGIIGVQAWFLKSYYRAINRQGVFHFPATMNLGNPDPWGPLARREARDRMETMPMKFKRTLTEQVVSTFQVDETGFERNVHGLPFLSLREDKGYFFSYLSKRRGQNFSDPRLHYVMLRGDLHSHLADWGTSVRDGPFRIIAYRPWVRDGSWRYHSGPAQDWFRPEFDDSTWAEVSMPARLKPDLSVYADVPFFVWAGAEVFLRGRIDVPTEVRRFSLVLSFRDDFAFQAGIPTLYLNGRAVPVTHMIRYNAVIAHHAELAFDLSSALKPGTNLVALHMVEAATDTSLAGQPRGSAAFDLDIYEFRD